MWIFEPNKPWTADCVPVDVAGAEINFLSDHGSDMSVGDHNRTNGAALRRLSEEHEHDPNNAFACTDPAWNARFLQ